MLSRSSTLWLELIFFRSASMMTVSSVSGSSSSHTKVCASADVNKPESKTSSECTSMEKTSEDEKDVVLL